MFLLCLCRSWQRWTGMGIVANTNWGTNWSKPSTWCLGAAERRGRTNGLMDRWTDGWMGGWGRRMGEGEVRAFCFSELFEQSAELLSVGPNWQPQLRPFSNQSISNLFVKWLIDWFEDWLTGWLGPQLPPFGGFWGGKSVSKPIWIHLQRDFNVEWSHLGAKNKPSRCICRFGFGFKFTAGVSRDQSKGAWLWKDLKTRLKTESGFIKQWMWH